jgi:hypothetical protein
MRYELAFNRGDGWLVFAEGDRPVVDGTLAIWDTTIGQPSNPVFPDGAYQLRLRVVRQDYNYDEYFVNDLVLANSMTPTPTATATLPQQATRQIGTPDPQASATSGFIIIRPTPLPSLTPFPSPSSPAAPSSAAAGTPAAPAGNNEDGDEGLLQRLLAIDTTRFGEAFWAGVRLAMFAFALIPLYLLVRALIRFAWRQFWTRDSHRN